MILDLKKLFGSLEENLLGRKKILSHTKNDYRP